MYVCKYVCMYVCMCIYVNTYMCTFLYVLSACVYIYTYMPVFAWLPSLQPMKARLALPVLRQLRGDGPKPAQGRNVQKTSPRVSFRYPRRGSFKGCFEGIL